MKKLKDILTKHLSISSPLALMALVFASVAANSACCFIYHQPEKPDHLKKLRRY